MGWRAWPLYDAVSKREGEEELLRIVAETGEDVNWIRVPHRFANAYTHPTLLEHCLEVDETPACWLAILNVGGDKLSSQHVRWAARTAIAQRRVDELEMLIQRRGPLDIYDTDDGLCWIFPDHGEAVDEETVDRMLWLLLKDCQSGMASSKQKDRLFMNHVSLTQNNETLLHLAAEAALPNLCRKLMELGLSPNAPSFGHSTPLGAAMTWPDRRGKLETISVLLDGGGSLSAIGMADQSYLLDDSLGLEPFADPQAYAEQGSRTVLEEVRRLSFDKEIVDLVARKTGITLPEKKQDSIV